MSHFLEPFTPCSSNYTEQSQATLRDILLRPLETMLFQRLFRASLQIVGLALDAVNRIFLHMSRIRNHHLNHIPSQPTITVLTLDMPMFQYANPTFHFQSNCPNDPVAPQGRHEKSVLLVVFMEVSE